MERACTRCGKKIGLMDFKYRLVYDDALFCKECSSLINGLLMKIRIPSTLERYDEAVKEFLAEISQSDLNKETKDALRMEAKLGYVQHDDLSKPFSATCNMSFEAACDAVRKLDTETKDINLQYEKNYQINSVDIGIIAFQIPLGQYNVTGLAMATIIHWSGTSKIEIDFSHSEVIDLDIGERIFLTMTKELEPYLCSKTEEFDAPTGRIGVFGGTFDPIHLGHIALAHAAVEEGKLEKLIVMPVYLQPFKQGRRVTDDEHRLAMAKLAFEGDPNIQVSSYEIDKMGVSYTYDTLSFLRKEYEGKELYFVTGTDSFLEIETWYKGADLLNEFSFMVSARPGYKEEELINKIQYYRGKYGTTIIQIHREMPDISSTEIRRRYGNKLKADDLVSEDVERYIKDNGLYGTNKRVY